MTIKKKNKKAPYTYKIVLDNFHLGMLNVDFIHLEYVLKKEFQSKSEAKIVDIEKKISVKLLNVKIDFPKSLQDEVYEITISMNLQLDTVCSKSIFFNLFKYISDFTILGVPGFDDVEIETKKRSFFENDNFQEIDEYIVVTNGKNISYIANIYGLDIQRTILNDIHQFHTIFGLEATRNLLFCEMYEIFDSNGISINRSHIDLLCDIMTCNGNITPINRFGLLKLNTQVLTKASFEKTICEFNKASLYKEIDNLVSNSSRVLTGLPTFAGTGLCNLQIDYSKLGNEQEKTNNITCEQIFTKI